MPFHKLLELGGCASASGNAIQTWKALCSQEPVFRVQAAHFLNFEDTWQATTGMLITLLWAMPSSSWVLLVVERASFI